MVQRTDGTFLIVPRFLTAGVVTKRFQLKVKETGKLAVRLCLLLISLHSGGGMRHPASDSQVSMAQE